MRNELENIEVNNLQNEYSNLLFYFRKCQELYLSEISEQEYFMDIALKNKSDYFCEWKKQQDQFTTEILEDYKKLEEKLNSQILAVNELLDQHESILEKRAKNYFQNDLLIKKLQITHEKIISSFDFDFSV